MALPDKIIFIDTETTGGSCQYDRIIEIGAIRVENGVVVDTFQTLVDPGQYVSDMIVKITQIPREQLEKAPTFRQIHERLEAMMEGCVFAAHNALFDYGFIKAEFAKLGKNIKMKKLCTVKLSRALTPNQRKHSLDAVIERYGLECEQRHRALYDAQATCDFFLKATDLYGETMLRDAVEIAMKHPSLPPGLEEEMIEDLPEEAGVYIFYGIDGMPLYIGKSINIKERVKSHFSKSGSDVFEQRIAQSITSMETFTTGGELAALIKESILIKKMQPLYNRRLRNSKSLVFAVLKQVGKYKGVKIESGTWPDGELMGIYRSTKSAKDHLRTITKKHKLCEKIMGLEKMKQRCFSRDMGLCRGACENIEDPIRYNMRFDMAFADIKIKPWPFPSPILIKEGKDNLVFDKWCYLGNLESATDELPELNFDLDTYKILSSFLRQKNNWKKIKTFIYK